MDWRGDELTAPEGRHGLVCGLEEVVQHLMLDDPLDVLVFAAQADGMRRDPDGEDHMAACWRRNRLGYGFGHFYIFVKAGASQLIEVRDGSNAVLLDYTASFTDGSAYTFALTGLNGSHRGVFLTDDTTAAPAGTLKVRTVHLAPLGPPMDLYITDANADLATVQPLATGVTYTSASAYVTAPSVASASAIWARHPSTRARVGSHLNSLNQKWRAAAWAVDLQSGLSSWPPPL